VSIQQAVDRAERAVADKQRRPPRTNRPIGPTGPIGPKQVTICE
jgi:hypothetical protein